MGRERGGILIMLGLPRDIAKVLGADEARYCQEQYFEDTTSNTSTPLHAEARARRGHRLLLKSQAAGSLN